MTPKDTAASSTADRVSSAYGTGRASTPPNPPPRGEGFPDVDRFERVAKIREGGVARARKLRAKPTHTEARLWKSLRQFEIRFRRQAPPGPYVVDFVCQSAKLVIEVDGGVHDLTDVALRDLKRDEWFEAQGYHVLRISTKRVENEIDAVVTEISKAAGVAVHSGRLSASTPSQPSSARLPRSFVHPLEGKGSSES